MSPYAGHEAAVTGFHPGTNLREVCGTGLTHRLLGDCPGWGQQKK